MTQPDLYPIKNSPNIDGIIFRHFEGESDFPKMLAIYSNLHAAGQAPGDNTIESLRAEYTNLSNSDPHDDVIFVEVNGETVGFSRVYWERQVATSEYSYGILFRVDPAWQGKGIEQSLIAWGETRGRRYASTLPEGEKGFFVTICREPDRTRFNILMEAGFAIDRYYHSMSRPLTDLPERPLPEGITVRPVLIRDYRKIWDASNDAFVDEYAAASPTEEWYQSYLASPNFQPFLWQVAWDGDEVVGSVQNYISMEENDLEGHNRGYTEGISVRREWRGRGVASSLICKSMAMFKAMNMDEVALTADTQNPTGAMRLYTNLGYRAYRTLFELRKPLNV
ncbi:MAG TPA: GNAT family N-acetyltransferase [Anaerolineaceae bacterium]|jgi:ribosomal protein S18 acetylase RimI-like enzyme|nr:GNAT family N-acetyltransferase [Anaerolineaceae bacterium]